MPRSNVPAKMRSRIVGIDGDAHHAAAFEVEGDVDALPIETVDLGDGVAGGGVEAERLHGSIPVANDAARNAAA